MPTAAQLLGGPVTQLGSWMYNSSSKPKPGMTNQPTSNINQPQMRSVNPPAGQGADQSWSDWFREQAFGRNESFNQVPTVTPQVMQLLEQILGQAAQGLQNPSAGFEPIAKAARTRFQSESIPGLADRFTALGGSDTRNSSDFAGMLGGAQSNFDQGLAALQAQYGLQNRDSLVNQFKAGLYPQFENLHRPGTRGAVGEAWDTGKQGSMQLLKLLPFLI